ncbi:ATP-binding protein [Granulosicoccaceae sp. 1_MG-2023]|nr:ATP-binding protein [Granulosicoccaceae sp. 1_MG-2023]
MKPLPRLLLLAIALPLILATLALIHQLLYQKLLTGLQEAEHNTLELVNSSLEGEIRQFRIIGSLLASNTELKTFLLTYDDVARNDTNRLLEDINRTTGALDTYLMNETGETIAASNWRSKSNFVGRNFSYRPYFQIAILGQSADFFAIGTSSNERGFYVGTPVFDQQKPVGVVVIKMRVDHLERLWQAEGRELSLIDDDGVVFVSTNTNWRYRSLSPLSDAQREVIAATRRYPDPGAITALQRRELMTLDAGGQLISLGAPGSGRSAEYLVQRLPMTDAGWTIHLASNTAPVSRVAFFGTVAIGFGLAGIGIIASALYQRQRLARHRLLAEQRQRNALEEAIVERTRDLREANAELLATQEKLVESGRLAAIGRFSAGLSHEISQPLTAIHSYLSNAGQLIRLQRYDDAQKKLDSIADLADRITLIIRQLKIFVRGDELSTAPVSLDSTFDAAYTVMADQLRRASVDVRLHRPDGELHVDGDEILLQQLIVNLLSNALDAVRDSDSPQLRVNLCRKQGQACIEVRDNGTGISEQDMASIFEPFYSTKKGGHGLGLGLTIAQEIVNRFHGKISATNQPPHGATFTVLLPLYRRSTDGL